MCGNRVKVVSVMYEVFKGLNVQRDMIGICVIYEGLKKKPAVLKAKKTEKEGLKGCQ